MTSPQCNDDGTNAQMVECPWCGEKIFRPGAAKLVDKQVFLHFPSANVVDGAVGETLRQHWMVDNQFHFENIGVTRAVEGDSRDPSTFRYLTCAACDKGPVGVMFIEGAQREFFVAFKRVAHS